MPDRHSLIEDILVLAPLRSIARIAEKVANENSIRAKVVFCSSNDVAIDWVKNYVAKGCKVIVSRGGMAMTIRKIVDIPVVNIEVTLEDFSAAVEKASKVNSIVGVMINAKIQHFFPEISRRYHVNLIDLKVAPGGDFIDALNNAIVNEHIDTLVCGVAPSRIAESMNFPYAAIDSSEYSINLALQKAQMMVDRKPSESIRNLSAFLEESSFGVIMTDLLGRVIFCNEFFARLLGLLRSEIIGLPLQSILVDFDEDDVRSALKALVSVHDSKEGRYVRYSQLTDRGYVVFAQKADTLTSDIFPLVQSSSAKSEEHKPTYHFSDIVTDNEHMKKLLWQARMVAKVDSTVLITGETGTGKEMLAQSIHNASRRSGRPFLAINCASIADSILESELFGYEDGAFTGARKGGRKGYFEIANGGTLFLDEIGELSPRMQSKLLRVLQQHEIIRVGGNVVIPVNVRIIAATLVNLSQKIREGAFRSDLYYRLNIIRLQIPPLRSRISDMGLLARSLVEKLSKRLDLPCLELEEDWFEVFKRYSWPGNIRELSNVLERLTIQNATKPIDIKDISLLFQTLQLDEGTEALSPFSDDYPTLEELELRYIRMALDRNGGNKAETCRRLGISPATLWRRLSAK